MKLKEAEEKMKRLSDKEGELKRYYLMEKDALEFATKEGNSVGDIPAMLSMIQRKIDYLNGWITGYQEANKK